MTNLLQANEIAKWFGVYDIKQSDVEIKRVTVALARLGLGDSLVNGPLYAVAYIYFRHHLGNLPGVVYLAKMTAMVLSTRLRRLEIDDTLVVKGLPEHVVELYQEFLKRGLDTKRTDMVLLSK